MTAGGFPKIGIPLAAVKIMKADEWKAAPALFNVIDITALRRVNLFILVWRFGIPGTGRIRRYFSPWSGVQVNHI